MIIKPFLAEVIITLFILQGKCKNAIWKINMTAQWQGCVILLYHEDQSGITVRKVGMVIIIKTL